MVTKVTKVRLDKMVAKVRLDKTVTKVTKVRLDKMVTKVTKVRLDKMVAKVRLDKMVAKVRLDKMVTKVAKVRLDKMVTKELAEEGFMSATLLLKALGRISEKKEDLHHLLEHGLGPKVLFWFETVGGLLGSEGYRNTGPLQNLAEEFYDYFLLLGQPSLHVSAFLLSTILSQLARLVLNPVIAFSPRLEAIRTYNTLLESLNREERKRLQVDINQHRILDELAASILTVGDYEFQVSISEALCRMTPKQDREQRAKDWFYDQDIIDAFCRIRDKDFEVDCRLFLNYINGCQGNQRRVYTFPCRRAFLGNTELFSPKDDKLDRFWIDFNLGSECISFFIDDQQGFLWVSVHLPKHGVESYTLYSQQNELDEEETVVRLELSRPLVHLNSGEMRVQLSFSPQHHSLVLEALGKVFGPPPSQETPGFLQMKDREEVLTLSRGGRTYYKKKPKSKLKILPLSSASSEDGSTPSRPLSASTPSKAEILFDKIIKMLPKDKTQPLQTLNDSELSAEGPDLDPEGTEDRGLDLLWIEDPGQTEDIDLDQEWTEDLGQTADSGVGLEKSEDRDPEPGRTREPERTREPGRTADSGVGLEQSEDRDPEPGRTRGEPGRTREPGRTADSDLDPARTTTRGLDPGRTTSGLDPRQTADPGRTVVRDLDPGRTVVRDLDPRRTVDCGDCGVSVNQNVLNTPRKRTSSRTEPPIGASCPKKKAWSIPVGEEPGPSLKDVPVEAGSDQQASIVPDFNNLTRQLQDSMAAATQRCCQRVEGQVVESFTEGQQNVSSLLMAVQKHRLRLLQRFERRVVDEMRQLQERFQSLSNMETELLSFVRTEMQSLASFCDRQQSGLASLDYKNQDEEDEEDGVERKNGGEGTDTEEA
ncbi:synaptonemal complex protein 2-like isoform X3 [Gadus chalcogrammus]|uniref:synaptonemal complex protein 2-like isoform X3 n=1 Tax=Gadus chalcogrammus TaxID=1042646 RepID=UPI0024C4833A|nr:synaptonemal complex protein 2-like isoform X3 [Gadus chalcogrammus]